MTTDFDEEVVISQITERLLEKFPTVDPARITELAREEVRTLAKLPVQDYISVLGERAVKKRLKEERRT
ncbi:MAG TPA: hypothetical protein VNT53_01485 [Pseudolysinimonas sp.]|nr:hypothetical protein [Pseudolysinimonas sp.]